MDPLQNQTCKQVIGVNPEIFHGFNFCSFIFELKLRDAS